jgi:hypothetical protein
MDNSNKMNLTNLNTEELVQIEAGSYFWDLGKAAGHFAFNYLDEIASGKLLPVHSGMLASK